MDSIKIYDKANSFIEIRHSDQECKNILERVQKVKQTLAPTGELDYNSQIILQACDDLLNGENDPTDHSTSNFYLRDHVIEEIQQISDQELPRYLFYRYRYDIFPVEKRVDDFPPCLQIEPTSMCNYRCVFCYQIDTTFTKRKNGHMGMMSLDLFKKIVDEAEGKCEAVTLASRGEPLMCPDIVEMLTYLQGKFLALKINTNASLLDEHKSHAILQAGFNTVVFSADAAEEPLYSQLRVNGKLEKVLANIELFQEIRSKHYSDSPTITRVSGVRYSEKQNLDEMEALWGQLVDQVAFVDYNPWESIYESPLNNLQKPCSDLWRRMFVWYNGLVNPCDSDYRSTMALGNIEHQSLSQLWTSDEYQALRQNHLDNQRHSVSPCNRCTVI